MLVRKGLAFFLFFTVFSGMLYSASFDINEPSDDPLIKAEITALTGTSGVEQDAKGKATRRGGDSNWVIKFRVTNYTGDPIRITSFKIYGVTIALRLINGDDIDDTIDHLGHCDYELEVNKVSSLKTKMENYYDGRRIKSGKTVNQSFSDLRGRLEIGGKARS